MKRQPREGGSKNQDDFFDRLDQAEQTAQSTVSTHHDSELILGFVAAVGVDLEMAERHIENQLREYGYAVTKIRVTKDVLPKLDAKAAETFENDFDRISTMMDVGTEARKQYGNDVIALGIADAISIARESQRDTAPRRAYLVHTLKHPAEVRRLREIYPRGFYLIGVHAQPHVRRSHLCTRRGIDYDRAEKLMKRDRKEDPAFGQQLVDTFHLADFFTGWKSAGDDASPARHEQLLKNSLNRFLEVLFAHPNRTPTFGEHAMYLAFSAALRSADLSRQVGAVIARDGEILSTGANDCPKFKGGLYWQSLDEKTLEFIDFDKGRDYKRKEDPNRMKQGEIIRTIMTSSRPALHEFLKENISEETQAEIEKGLLLGFYEVLKKSPIRDLTEYGRVVHAEMEAILSCARQGISTRGATLYSTTFPCHNCAKHILASGIERVVFVEPYLKSKALEFHDESIEIAYPELDGEHSRKPRTRLRFEPFSGIGPRRFFDLFSVDMGIGSPLIRKDSIGRAAGWENSRASLRIDIMNSTYTQREAEAKRKFRDLATVLESGIQTNAVEGSQVK